MRDILGVPRAALLGVPDGADAEATKRAYHRLARWLHPDKAPEGVPPEVAAAWFQLLAVRLRRARARASGAGARALAVRLRLAVRRRRRQLGMGERVSFCARG